jgi:hypothetical protein
MIKATRFIGILLMLAIAVAGLPAISGGDGDAAKQVDMLKKQVTALEERVDRLEVELRKITVSIPQAFPELKQLPKGWQRREFNGMPYYIIPLDVGAKNLKMEKR